MNKENYILKTSWLFILFFVINNVNSSAQALSGSKTIPSVNFPTVKAAVDSLNAQGVGTGGVTFNVAAAYTETLTAGLVLTATGTLSNPIVFQKDPLTSGANPLITSYVGTLLASSTTTIDVMWSFEGSDFVTINGIDLVENAANTTPVDQMEVGYGFYKVSATNGANNNTIQNCTITLNRNNVTSAAAGPRNNGSGSVGIEFINATRTAVGTAITVTSVAGASSNNKIYGNTIQNVHFGITLSGFAAPSPYTLADLNNDIGGTSAITGNNIINFGGGASGTCGAILINNQWSFNISYNTVNNNNGNGINHPGGNRGIWLFNSSAGASCNINFNKITISAGASTTAISWCLDLEMATTGANGNVINILNNQFLNCRQNAASTVAFTAIWLNTAATTVNCNNNYFYGFTYAGTGTTQVILSQVACGTLNINNNFIDSTTLTGATATGTHYNIGVTTAPTVALSISGNIVTRTYLNTIGTGTKTLYPIYASAATPTINLNNNLVDSVTRNGTTGGTTIGIYHVGGTNGTTTVNCRRNIVRNMSISGSGTTSTLYGIQIGTGTIICDSNEVYNLICLKPTGTGALYGIYDISSPNNETFSNNKIYDLTHLGTGLVYGIYAFTTTGVRTVNNNNIFNLTGNGGNVIGLLMTSSSPTITRNKIYSLLSNGATTGTVFGISLTSVGTSGTATITNNLIDSLVAPNYTGATDAIRGISSTIATATSNLRIYYNTIRLNATSVGANFSSSSVFFTGNATATTAALDLRNNIIVNNSTPNGTGLAVALRNSTAAFTNYANSSNNNLFYSGIPSAANLVYYDGTNSDITIGAFKTRLVNIEQASFTENPTFISNIGASPDFLHLDLVIPTTCESGGAAINGFTTDFDNMIRQGNAGYIGTGTAPDVGADEGDFVGLVMTLDSSNVDQITAAVPINSTNQHIVAIRVHTSNSFNALNLTSLKLNTAGTTNVNDIQNAKVFYTGSNPVYSNINQFGATISNPNGTFLVNGNRTLASGVNYFWVTYDVKSTATPNNIIDVRVDSLVIGGNNTAPINGDPIGARTILGPLSGNYTIGVGQNYTTITNAINDLKSLGVNGPVVFTLKDALYNTASGEIFPIVFNNYFGASTTNTVTILPDFNLTSRIESSDATATFDLNGITNLIIDGRQGGTGAFISGNNLTIANTGSNGPAIRFINEANGNSVLYTDLRSNNIIAPGTVGAGVVNFGVTTGLNGNDNNTIKFCDIHENGTGNPTIGISSIGSVSSVAANNDGNIIDSCNIYNFFHPTIATAGIYIGANNGSWIINGNRLYQTSSVNTTGTQVHRVMWITPNTASLTSASGFVITNNFIGGNASNGSGTYTMTGAGYQFYAMDISVGIGAASSVQNNTFTNFALTSSFSGNGFYGINIANGNVNVGTIAGNLIGSTTTNGAITFTTTAINGGFICLRSGAGGTINFSNNIISGIDLISNSTTAYNSFNGIAGSGGSNIIINNNTVGSTTLINSINMLSSSATATGASAMRGIICNSVTAGAVNTVTNNLVANLNSNYAATGTQGTTTVGIAITTGTSAVTGNIIRNLTSATQTTSSGGTSAIIGMSYTSTTAPVNITRNYINNLVLTGTSTTAAVQCGGLFYGGPTSGANAIDKNYIHSISLNANNAAAVLTGMDIATGVVTISNNMVRLGHDSLGIDITAPCTIRGISKNTATANVFFNSVYIGGSGVGSIATNTFAFQRTAAATDNIRNNIFMNARSNASTGGKHYQAYLLNATTLNLNNNIYFGGGSGSVFGSNNNGVSDVISYTPGWVATDLNGGFADPQFINPSGTSQTGDLHISSTSATPVESSGVLITTITDDFDGQVRSGLTATDIGADAGNFIALDIFAPAISTPIVSNTSSTGDRIFNLNITDATGVTIALGTEPKVYFKKSFAGAFASTSATRISGNPQNGIYSFNISSSLLGLSLNDSIYFYLVAQDSSSIVNLSSMPAGVIGTNVNSITTPPTSLFSYKIVPGISGNVNVGVGQTYTSLTNAGGLFEAINNGSVNGNVNAFITSDLLEDGTNGINQINETGAGNYTITILPDNATERLIAGSTNAGLIRFNGGDRVKIDGRFAGSGRFLRIRNRALAGYAIAFVNDSKLDTVTNCIVESVNNTVGTITFLGTNLSNGFGNDSNAIINCLIRDTLGTIPASNIPNTGMFSQATAGFGNDYNTFSNNEIVNFGFNGLNLSATSGDFWNITNNSFYQTIAKANVITIIVVAGGNGHTIANNSFGGSTINRSGTAFTTTSTTIQNIIGINSTVASTIPININNNTFSNIASGRGVNLVSISAGLVNVTNNTFGGAAQPYDTIQNGYDNGIITVTGGTVNIANNLIGNVSYYGNAGDRTSGMTISGGTTNIVGNTIKDIRSNSTGTAFTFLPTGIQISGGTNHNIQSNTISNIVNTNAGASAYTVAGITLTGSTNLLIQQNRIFNIWGLGTGVGTTSVQAFGIYNANINNTTVRNNQISIGNNTIGQTRVYGIQDVATSGTNSYYNNSIFVNGTTIGGANNSYCLQRTGLVNINSFNNVFYNKRTTTGTGFNFATGSGSLTGITPNTTNYNLYVINDSNRVAEGPTGFANSIAVFNSLYTNANTYSSNWYELGNIINAQNLFTDTLTGNLSIVTTNANSWYVNGKGLALSTVSNDFSNTPRSTTIVGGATDIGSTEFNTLTIPIPAVANAAPALNSTTVYTFANREVARINWGSNGTVPSAVNVLYYSGANSPNLISGATYLNAYYNISATGGVGYNCGLALLADSANFGLVSGSNNTRLAQYTASTWNLISASNANGATGTIQTSTSNINAFGVFTGTDFATNPLPVTLSVFNANKFNNDVLLTWNTANETNNKGFEIQRSVDGATFNNIGFVKGFGNSNQLLKYSFNDAGAFTLNNHLTLYYRLKQIDFNGKANYSGVVSVNNGLKQNNDLVVYPNPFSSQFSILINSANKGNASIDVVNLQGKVIITKIVELVSGTNNIAIEENNMVSSGIYLLRTNVNGIVTTTKLVKN